MRRCVAVWGMLMIAMPAGMAVAQTATQNDVDGGNSPAEQAVPQPIADPRSVFKADDYPVEALRNNEEGRITTSLDVDASGRPTRCNVITSSGSAAIDATTCSIFLPRAFQACDPCRQGRSGYLCPGVDQLGDPERRSGIAAGTEPFDSRPRDRICAEHPWRGDEL